MKKFIKHEDVPRWYHLFWNRKTGSLCIKIHRFFLDNCEYKNFEPYFRGLCDKPSFLPFFDKCEPRLGRQFFGINDSISLVEEDEEWMIYRIKIPNIVHRGNFVFRLCNEVCYSLAILFSALQFPVEQEVGCKDDLQLFTLTSISEVGEHGHSVGGYGSPEFLRFLESFSSSCEDQVDLPSVVKVMRKAHSLIYGKVQNFDRFACIVRKGQFIIDCPGDACQIHSESDEQFGSDIGNDITCHNLDSSMQQLTLLSGIGEIASLYDDWRALKLGENCRI